MFQGSRTKGLPRFRDEVKADGGSRRLRHSARYAEEKFWRAEELTEESE